MNSLQWNSVDLSGSSYGLIVTKSSWPSLASPIVDIQKVAFGPAVSYGIQMEPKVFNVNCVVQGSSTEDLHEKLGRIAALLMVSTEQTIRFDAFRPTQYWKARYTGGLEEIEYLGLTAASFKLTFVCPDPVAYALTARTTPDITLDADPKVFNLEASSVVPGNWYSKPVFIVKAVNGSNSIVLTNATTGETLTYAQILDNGYWLKIDSELFLVSLSGDAGVSWAPSMTYVTGSFPRLKPGVVNGISISGVNTGGSLSISYSGRYL